MDDFKTFYQSLNDEQKESFAKKANTSAHYIATHLIYARKVPKRNLMNSLAKACEEFNSGITKTMLLNFFHQD